MKKLLYIFLLTLSFSSYARTGEDLLKYGELRTVKNLNLSTSFDAARYEEYIDAVIDSHILISDNVLICVQKGMSTEQFYDVVLKYLKNHPEKRKQPAVYLIIAALEESFPCKAK